MMSLKFSFCTLSSFLPSNVTNHTASIPGISLFPDFHAWVSQIKEPHFYALNENILNLQQLC